MKLDTINDLQIFLRHVTAQAKHHGKYALPVLGPLLFAALTHGDPDSFSSTTNHSGGPGVQIRFKFRGRKFKLKATGRTTESVALYEVIGIGQGPALVEFDEFDDPAEIESILRKALLLASRAAA